MDSQKDAARSAPLLRGADVLIRSRSIIAFLSRCCALLIALTAPLTAAPNALARCSPAPLLAMTYNIRLDTSADGPNSWVHRKDFLIGQIAALRPELLGLQEVLINQKQDLEAAFPNYRFVGVGRDDGVNGGEFSPLAVDIRQFEIVESGTFWLSPTPDVPSLGWDANIRRVVSWARLVRKADRARILVLNTHWDHQGRIARRESGRLILDWIQRNRRNTEKLILIGDFNADEGEESIVQLTNGSSGGVTLVNARHVSAAKPAGPTVSFNAFNAFPASGGLIDHIFVDAGIAVRSYSVIAQHDNGRVASDHFPVVALIDIPSSLRAHC